MTKDLKKYLILGFLFFFPIFVYVFLSTGINNFAKLPVLTYGVNDIVDLEGNLSKVSLKDNISIETLVILDRILGFRKDWDKKLQDPVWETVSMRMKKYSPFLNIEVSRYKKVLKEIVLK